MPFFLHALDANYLIAFVSEISYPKALISKEYRTLNALFSSPLDLCKVSEKLKNLRRIVYLNLDPLSKGKNGLSKINVVIIAVIFLAVVTTIIETESSIRERVPNLFLGLNIFYMVVFSLEYLARIWVLGEEPKYRGLTGRLKYIFSIWSIIDLLAIIPFMLTFGSSDTLLLRFFRFLRLLSLAKLGKYSKPLDNIVNAISNRKNELMLSMAGVFLLMLSSSVALYLAEGSTNPEHFGSIPRSFWWGAATISKVGYGGAFPQTVAGKFFAIIFAITAIGIVAIPTGIIAGSFYEACSKKEKDLEE